MSNRIELEARIGEIKRTICGLESKYGGDPILDDLAFAEAKQYEEEVARLEKQLAILDKQTHEDVHQYEEKLASLENKLANLDKQKLAEVQQYKEKVVFLENQLTEEAEIPESSPMQWSGSDTDLVDLFLILRKKHYIKAPSEYSIFQQLVRHFINKDGKILKYDNLKKAAKARELSGKSPFDCIPENDKAKHSKDNG